MSGNLGDDTFVFNFGNSGDTMTGASDMDIQDLSTTDTLRFDGSGDVDTLTALDLIATVTDGGTDTTIEFTSASGTVTITLRGVSGGTGADAYTSLADIDEDFDLTFV